MQATTEHGVDAFVAQGHGLAYEERGTGVPVVSIHGLTFKCNDTMANRRTR